MSNLFSNFKRNRLYVITDANLTPGESLIKSVAEAIDGGASMVQYRNKEADFGQKMWEIQDLRILCNSLNIPLIVNDDVKLAIESGADGVHLGKEDMSVVEARSKLGDSSIIGVSCYNDIGLAEQAQIDGASYVAFGSCFVSKTKPNSQCCSLSTITAAKDKLTIPVVAIGGIDQTNVKEVIEAGADIVAVISGVFSQKSIQNAASLISNQFVSS